MRVEHGTGVQFDRRWHLRSAVSLPSTGNRAFGRRRRPVREPVGETLLQVFDVPPLFARTSPATSEASFAHRCSKATSDGVNIRRAGEVPSLRLSKAIEGVAEMFPPPFLEVRAVFPSEFMELFLREIQFCRIWLSGQPGRADDRAALFRDPAAQIRQCAALADEVVHHHILTVFFDFASENRLPCQSSVAVGLDVDGYGA